MYLEDEIFIECLIESKYNGVIGILCVYCIVREFCCFFVIRRGFEIELFCKN